jgi:hypothetical protein
LSLAPEYMDERDNDGDKSTLNLTVILHGITQTHCTVVPKATDNTVKASTTSRVISPALSRLFGTKCCPNPHPKERKHRPISHRLLRKEIYCTVVIILTN